MLGKPVSDLPIGFVGLGTMGLPMAEHLVDAGFDVTAFDVRDGPLEAFAAAGGATADSVASLATICRVVSVVVETAEQVEAVVAGEDGLFEGLEERGGIVLIHSTVHPETPETLSAAAPSSLTVLDAPVSGTRTRAESGELAFMVGGDEAAVSACRPLFEAMGTSVHHLGSVGSGEAAKLANNLVGISNMLTTAEGIALGTEWGLDEDELRSVMMSSSAESFALEHWDFLTEDWGAVQPGGFEGAADILAKDLDTALSLARSLELEVPGAAVAAQRVPAYFRDLGGGD